MTASRDEGRMTTTAFARRSSSVILALALVGWLSYQDRAVLPHVEYAGVIGQVSGLASEIGPEGVVVFDDPAPVGSGAILGMPLQYLYGLSVFDLQPGWAREGLDAAIRLGLEQGRPVYLLARPDGGAANTLAAAGVQLGPPRRVTIDAPVLEQSYTHFPTAVNRFVVALDLYPVTAEPDN
jgi:hypothetical protein